VKTIRVVTLGLVLSALPVLGLLAAGEAHAAAVRWASPTGSGTACTEAAPCGLETAVEDPAVVDGDEVVVTAGSYSVDQLSIGDAIELHGQGQPSPTITTTNGVYGVVVSDAATIHDLKFVGVSTGLGAFSAGATLERLDVRTSAAGAFACATSASIVIRDSLCRASGANAAGVGINISAGAANHAVTLRNVTALGGGNGVSYGASGSGLNFAVDAKNVIADGGTNDVYASAQGGASVVITLANSNYATQLETTVGGGVAATITDPGTGTNQTAAPVFVDAANGNFHQGASSPTLDAGVQDASTGTQDIDGEPRAQRSTGGCPEVVDIGADERGTLLECDPPETTITGPTGATEDSTPTFQLTSDEPGSTFECRVDATAFAACTSPYTTSVLALGAHTVEARAIDPSGNADPTPATRSVTVTAPAAAAAPETTITQAPAKKVITKKKRAKVTFGFSSSLPGTFECSLDGGPFAACTSPTQVKLRKGKHTFAVRAVSATGAVDPTPATLTFKVKVKPRR